LHNLCQLCTDNGVNNDTKNGDSGINYADSGINYAESGINYAGSDINYADRDINYFDSSKKITLMALWWYKSSQYWYKLQI
jgi:hypothetical protein